MGLYFTRHARNRMRLYDIVPEEVEAAVKNPQQVTAGAFGRHHAWKPAVHGGWLRVTFKDEGTRRTVITVTPKRQGPGGHDAH